MKRPKSSKIINSDSSSESEEEEEEWKSRPKRVKRVESSSDGSSESGPEEGELSSDQEEEDDGLDEDLMGDEADRRRLAQMTEKEREEELFKRAEMREAMKARRSVKEKLREEKRRRQQQMQRQQLGVEKDTKDTAKDKEKSKHRREAALPGTSQSGSRGTASTSRQKALEEKRNGANKFAQLIERRKAKLKTSEIFSDEDESSSSSSGSESDDFGVSSRKVSVKKNTSERSVTSEEQRQSRTRGRESVSSGSSESSLPRGRRHRKHSGSSSDSSGSSPGRSPSRSSSPGVSEEGECRRSESSGDEGVSWSRGTKKSAPIESLEELLRIKLSRYKMEKWVHMPFFKNLVVGCFVRVGIGNRDGIAIYRIAEIEDVVETGKIYDLGSTRTNRGLILRHAEDKQMFRLCFLSNQDFSQSEWDKWLGSLMAAKLPLPTRSFVHKKEQEILHALNHRIEDEAELERILDEKKRFRRGPTNYTVQKIELIKERQLAENEGDTSKVARLNLEITDLESEANERERRRTSAIKSITYINERNRAQNMKLAEEASKREFEELEEMQRNGQQDPFSRLQTRPVLFGKKRQQAQDGKLKQNEGKDLSRQSQLDKQKADSTSDSQKNAVSEKDGISCIGPECDGTAGDVFSIHNFDINIDLDVPLSAPLPPSVPVNASAGSGIVAVASVIGTNNGPSLVSSRRGLNLEEYKKRRGLI